MSVPVEFVNDRGNKVEIKDTEARRLAGVAQTAAENAQSTANGANTLAQQAKDKADTAYTDAGTAQSTATAAGTLAQQAKDIADATSSVASTNAENINILDGKVTVLENNISDIESDIEEIKEDYISKEELQSYDSKEDTEILPIVFNTNEETLLDWRIDGNNNPKVENSSGTMPLVIPSNGDNILDYTIYGNNNPYKTEPDGTLPLTFDTSETSLRSWTIYGNNYEHTYSADQTLPLTFNTNTAGAASDWSISGNDNVGKNLIKITVGSGTYTVGGANLTYTVDRIAGTITLNGTSRTDSNYFIITFSSIAVYGDYIISGGSENASYRIWDITSDKYARKIDNSAVAESFGDDSTVRLPENHAFSHRIRVAPNKTFDGVVLPLMLRQADTSADFEPYQVGVGQRTENLFDINTSTLVPIGTDTYRFGVSLGKLDAGDYVLSFVNSNQYSIYITKRTGTTYTSGSAITATTSFYVASTVDEVYIRTTSPLAGTVATWATLGFADIMVTAGSTAPSTYVPYGYKIPLTINNTPQTFYIGDSPLTAGQSISKTSTGVDIATAVGENTISTTLYNKPETAISYVDFVGVGEPTTNGYQTTLSIKQKTDNLVGECRQGEYNDLTSANVVHLKDIIMANNGDIFTIKYFGDLNTSDLMVDIRGVRSSGVTDWETNGYITESYSITSTSGSTIGSSYTYTFTAYDDRVGFIVGIRNTNGNLTPAEIVDNLVIVKGNTTISNYYPQYNINTENIYLGNSPLTAGQSVTQEQTNQQIHTFVGENTIDTTSANKFNMHCGMALGVGIPTTGSEPAGYKIPITVTDTNSNTTTTNVYIGNSRLLNGDSITKTQADVDISTSSGNNTISTSLDNKPNIDITYNSNVIGVGERTENLFNKNATNTSNGYEDNVKAQWSHSNSLEYVYENDNDYFISEYMSVVAGQDYYPTDIYITSAFGNYFSVFFYDSDKQLILRAYNNTAGKTVAPDNAAYMRVCIAKNKVDSAMITTKSTDTYIPFGYKIPLVINDTNKDIYIGNSLLTSGNSVSKTSTGIDINTIKGENTISTTLDNKPNMYIKYSVDEFSRTFTTTLPTTFINHSNKVKDWVIYGNENGVGIETDNIFNGTYQNASITVNNNTYTYDTSSTGKVAIIPCEASTQYTVKKFTTSDKLLICEYTAEPQNNDTLTLIEDVDADSKTFTTSATAQYIIILVSTTDTEPNMTLVTGSTAPTSYIPYGYKVPLTVNGVEIPIYIGNSTLGANDTVSKTSIGIDIPTVDGENTITTTLTNKPTIKITKDFVTKEYIEDVANSCMNENVEDIVENVVDDKVDKQMFFMFYSSINKNGMFRGKDLTNVYTVNEIYQKVSSGDFDDLYLGDYITKSITTDIYTKFTGSSFASGTTYYNRTGTLDNWVYTETEDETYDSSKTYYTKKTKTENTSLMIAHFNYYYNMGDTALTKPHIILVPRNYGFATTSKMNPTNTTTGGYYNSEMHQTTLPCYAKSLDTALENHILTHRTILSNATNASTPSMAGAGLTGASSGWAWVDTKLQLMTEQQLYGSGIWTSSAYDVGVDGEKLAVFNFVNGVQSGRVTFWLRSVASSASFALCTGNGLAYYYYASNARYVRPLIVFG